MMKIKAELIGNALLEVLYMDDFDNFFNGGGDNQNRTPIYHTPTDPPKKTNPTTIICICIAVFMCIVVMVNVIVLVSLKSKIAEEYAASISDTMRQAYADAISDALGDTDIISDVTDSATATALDKLASSTGEVVAANCLSSVVSVYCTSTQESGTASGFVITDVDTENGITQRYVVTNAHVVVYEKATTNNSYFYGRPTQTTSYSIEEYDSITCQFKGETKYYTLTVVAVGGVTFDHASSDNSDQSDLAICAFSGDQPDETEHPSLKIAAAADNKITKTGDEIVLIGNPQGIGISMSTGLVSNDSPDMTLFGTIVGEFIMTDAAVNAGNSGGPMINKNCVVIGVVESKLASSSIDNMGFAVSAVTLGEFIAWAEDGDHNELGKDITINATYSYIAA